MKDKSLFCEVIVKALAAIFVTVSKASVELGTSLTIPRTHFALDNSLLIHKTNSKSAFDNLVIFSF